MDWNDKTMPAENEIRKLLEKYFDGITTLGEEQVLRDYFTSGLPVPEDLAYARGMFCFFRHSAGQQPSPVSVAQLTDKQENDPHGIQDASGGAGERSGRRNLRMPGARRLLCYAASLAAVIAVLLAIFMPSRDSDSPVVYCYVDGVAVTDPQVAMEYTARALSFVGESLRKPAECLAPLGEFNRSMEAVGAILQLKLEDIDNIN